MTRVGLNSPPMLLEAEEHPEVGMRNSVRGFVWVALAITLIITIPNPELIPISHLQMPRPTATVSRSTEQIG